MPKTLMIAVVNLVAVFVSSGVVFAQVADDGVGQGRTQAELADPDKWKYDPDLKRDPWKYYATDYLRVPRRRWRTGAKALFDGDLARTQGEPRGAGRKGRRQARADGIGAADQK